MNVGIRCEWIMCYSERKHPIATIFWTKALHCNASKSCLNTRTLHLLLSVSERDQSLGGDGSMSALASECSSVGSWVENRAEVVLSLCLMYVFWGDRTLLFFKQCTWTRVILTVWGHTDIWTLSSCKSNRILKTFSLKSNLNVAGQLLQVSRGIVKAKKEEILSIGIHF